MTTIPIDVLRRTTQAPLELLTDNDPPKFGSYELLARLPWGERSRVYLARQAGSDGPFLVVKTLRENVSSIDLARFDREALNARRVNADCVARVVDHIAEPLPVLIQEFVSGPTLEMFLNRTVRGIARDTLQTNHALAIATAVIEAIAAVHSVELAHRDLNSRNIILNPARGPVLIDFGISLHKSDIRLTVSGSSVGTPPYMSRERFEGAGGTSADIFSWGILATYLLAGYHAFDPEGTCKEPRDYYLRLLTRQPDLSAVSSLLRVPIFAALQLNAADRPTALELLAALDKINASWVAGRPPIERQQAVRTHTLILGPSPYERQDDALAFYTALESTSEKSADRGRVEQRELRAAARGFIERISVMIYGSPLYPHLALPWVRIAIVIATVIVGLTGGTVMGALLRIAIG